MEYHPIEYFNLSYNCKNNFIKYPHNPTISIDPPNLPTIIKDMPFVGKTSYNQSFLGNQTPKDPEYDRVLTLK